MQNHTFISDQQARNAALLEGSHYLRGDVRSEVLPWRVDLSADGLSVDEVNTLNALEKKGAAIALSSLASLSKIGELDHLGGGLELLPSLLMTLGVTDYDATHFTIEHAHTSIGYYGALAALGFIEAEHVVEEFRRSLDIAGHVSWLPGGTQLNGGRLGVMVPVAVGQALGLHAHKGDDAMVVCHCGDAGWISGQALNGFNGASLHSAPIVFLMHRNGIQLSNTTRNVMDLDPRKVIAALGIEILEIESQHDKVALFGAYKAARALASKGRPCMIYPTGSDLSLVELGERYGIGSELEGFAGKHSVGMDRKVWVPGSLMSWRDVGPMMECIFHVNDLEGGEGHHDGHMKGRDLDEVLGNPMLVLTADEEAAYGALAAAPKRVVETKARPAVGTANLLLSADQLAEVSLPEVGKLASCRAGSEAGYAAVAKAYPSQFFNVVCDLNPSTKLGKADAFLARDHSFEMSIEEQVATLMVDGLAMSSYEPQLNVFATFSAFFEGIAREGLELWRYHRNLNGRNEGLNVCMHLSHVGACTGRDHFSGWSLDWITLAMGYLPYLRRFYTPADARGAFVAVKDLAAGYGGHIIGIPRDNVPVLSKQDGSGALYDADSAWEPLTVYRTKAGATKAVLAVGCTAFLADEAAAAGADVYVVNGLPLAAGQLAGLVEKYEGLVSVEDGIIATPEQGLRGFASMLQSVAVGTGTKTAHVGITDPTVAPSEGFAETWEHFGLTAAAVLEAVDSL